MKIARLSSAVAVSAQIAAEDLDDIAAAGFRTIINNRPDGEAPDQPPSAEIEVEARRRGLAYAYVPVPPGQLDDDVVRAFDAALAALPGPALAYCRTGTRSASLWALREGSARDADDVLGVTARAGYDLHSLQPRLRQVRG